MSNEGPLELAPRPAPKPSNHQLDDYVSTLRSESEVASLIVALEEQSRGDSTGLPDPGVAELATRTGLDLGSPDDLRRAILALGARAERLQGQRAGRAPRLERRDLGELTEGLLQVMETTRQASVSSATLEAELRHAVGDALDLWQRNLPPRSESDARWWQLVRVAVEQRMIPGYLQAARRLDAVEAEPLRGLMFRSPVAVAVLAGLAGLLTFAVPISTPVTCLLFALVGYYLLHPYYVQQVVEPLRALGENLVGEAGRIERLSGERPWTPDRFTLSGVVDDLGPILEAERRAGRGAEGELRQAIAAYFDEVTPAFEEAGRGGRYLSSLRGLVEGRLAREYARYADARTRWEGRWLATVVDTPAAAAGLLAFLTIPVSWIVSRISPLPPSIDFPAMIAMFGLLGYALPALLPGTTPSRAALLAALTAEQDAIESIP